LAADSTNAICAIAAKFGYVSPSRNIILTSGRKSRCNDTENAVLTLSGFTLSGICEEIHTFRTKIGVFFCLMGRKLMSKRQKSMQQGAEYTRIAMNTDL
jgi:hypothetical protein